MRRAYPIFIEMQKKMEYGPNMIGNHGVLNPTSKLRPIAPMRSVVAIEGDITCLIRMTLSALDVAEIRNTLAVLGASLPTLSFMGISLPSSSTTLLTNPLHGARQSPFSLRPSTLKLPPIR